MNWTEASIVVDRFIRLMDADLNELKQKHVLIKQVRFLFIDIYI
jgi:hypothetical protein